MFSKRILKDGFVTGAFIIEIIFIAVKPLGPFSNETHGFLPVWLR
jgi:hypothetical protein